MISKLKLSKNLQRFILLIIAILLCILYQFFTYCSPHAHGAFPAYSPTAEDSFANASYNFQPPKEGSCVYVNLDAKILCLYENGEMTKTWPVSGGAKETPSPTGQWIINGIGNWGEGFGGSWISLNVPWGKYGIHGTVEPWAVGNTNGSHGCIRMKDADVGELKKYVSYGTPVYIEYPSIPFRALKDGKIGSDVYELQSMLRDLGYYNGNPDGKFGAGTAKAVKAFQKEEGLTIDGIVGKGTWDLLKQYSYD